MIEMLKIVSICFLAGAVIAFIWALVELGIETIRGQAK